MKYYDVLKNSDLTTRQIIYECYMSGAISYEEAEDLFDALFQEEFIARD